jgi:divalent metal cation (Fe/Co/Zn/Cd) transporter
LNCILAVLQIYGATSSLSYSLFATMADSIFDPFSNVTLWITHRAAKKIDERKYPAVIKLMECLLMGREKQGWRRWGISCFLFL